MSKEDYSQEILTEYLLGSLSDSEMERFEELTFTDNEFADLMNAAEKDLVDAYVAADLAGSKREKFESYYLASPLRRKRVKFASAFQVFTERELAGRRPKEAGLFATFKDLITKHRLRLSILFIGGLRVFDLQNKNTQTETAAHNNSVESEKNLSGTKEITSADQENVGSENNINTVVDERLPIEIDRSDKPDKLPAKPKVTSASFVLSPPLRGTSELQTISFPKETATIKMTIKLEGSDYKTYNVALTDELGKHVWQTGNLRSKNDALNVNFSAKLLKPRIYSLVVTGIKADGEAEIISNYPFRTVFKQALTN